jgi:hypothetical protein
METEVQGRAAGSGWVWISSSLRFSNASLVLAYHSSLR